MRPEHRRGKLWTDRPGPNRAAGGLVRTGTRAPSKLVNSRGESQPLSAFAGRTRRCVLWHRQPGRFSPHIDRNRLRDCCLARIPRPLCIYADYLKTLVERRASNSEAFVCTQKDLVKLRQHQLRPRCTLGREHRDSVFVRPGTAGASDRASLAERCRVSGVRCQESDTQTPDTNTRHLILLIDTHDNCVFEMLFFEHTHRSVLGKLLCVIRCALAFQNDHGVERPHDQVSHTSRQSSFDSLLDGNFARPMAGFACIGNRGASGAIVSAVGSNSLLSAESATAIALAGLRGTRR